MAPSRIHLVLLSIIAALNIYFFMIYQSSAPRLTCIASALSHLSTGHHVAVADIMDSNNLRLLFFAPDNPCPALRRRPRLRPPQHWQSRAAVTCAAECAIAADWFPESDYVGLFVVLLALLPPYRLLSTLADHDAPRFLILGNGGGVLSQLIQRLVPNALVDSVEPDAAVIQLGRLYFGGGHACISKLADARQRSCVHEMSDRSFVRRALKRREEVEEVVVKYDMIYLDAFEWFEEQESNHGNGADDGVVSSDASMPNTYLTHYRWCADLRSLLQPHGVLAANLWRADEVTATLRKRCDHAFGDAGGGGERIVLEPYGVDAGRHDREQTVEAWQVLPREGHHRQDERRRRAELGEAAARLRLPSGRPDLGALLGGAWRAAVALYPTKAVSKLLL